MLKYTYFCKIFQDYFTIVCTCFLNYILNITFWSSDFCTCVLIYSLHLTFQSSEYKETIISIFHSFNHGEFIAYELNLILLSDMLCIPMVSISYIITFSLLFEHTNIDHQLSFTLSEYSCRVWKKGYQPLGMVVLKKGQWIGG